jgi:AbrB family looped-hinge helix DNA binding protein
MMSVIVSSKYQIVIPKHVREVARIKPGTELEVLVIGSQIRLVPVLSMESLFGSAPGIDTTIEREDDRL